MSIIAPEVKKKHCGANVLSTLTLRSARVDAHDRSGVDGDASIAGKPPRNPSKAGFVVDAKGFKLSDSLMEGSRGVVGSTKVVMVVW